MARIQVLPLTVEKVGDIERTPFVLVIDQVDDPEWYTDELMGSLKRQTGAAAVWMHTGPFDVATPLELTDEQRQHLLGLLTSA